MLIALATAAAVLCSAQSPAARTPAGTARVRGIVVTADRGAPVARAAVRLSSPGAAGWETVSDAAGRFEIAGLPAGQYALTARKAGFVTSGAGQADAAAPILAFALRDGQTHENVTVRMFRGGAIEGRLVDENGEPVVEASVRALRAEYIAGGRRLRARHTVQTDDRGQFRLYGLPPGRYYVVSALRSLDLVAYDPQQPTEVMRGASGFAPTFYPGTAVAADAQPVTVRASEDAVGVDFTLTAVRLARISGVVVDSRGRPAAGTVVMLNSAGIGGAVVTGSVLDMHFVEPSADGSFNLSNVKPGEYRVDVRSKAGLEAVARTGSSRSLSQGPEVREYASMPVTVSGDDIEGLRVTTTAGRTMSGRIVVHAAAAPADLLQRLSVSTYDLTAGLGMSAVMLSAGAPVQPDGTFEVRGVSGRRSARIDGLPRGWALKSARLSGIDVTDEGIEVRDADILDVEVTITATPSQISGTVVDGLGRPLAAAIIVFPDDRRRWTSPPNRHLASARAAADGSFTVSPLPAGDYLIAIVDELVDGEWAEPDTLERLRQAAVSMKLADGENRTITLRRR